MYPHVCFGWLQTCLHMRVLVYAFKCKFFEKQDRITLLYQRSSMSFQNLNIFCFSCFFSCCMYRTSYFVSSIYHEYSAISYKTITWTIRIFTDLQKFIHENREGWNVEVKFVIPFHMYKMCHWGRGLWLQVFQHKIFFVNSFVLNPPKMLFSFFIWYKIF